VDNLSFRAEFHRALDPLAPPAPWLAAAVREEQQRRRRKMGPVARGARRLAQPSWLLPAVAALLALAIILAIVVGARVLLLNQTVPVKPPQHGLAGPAGCPGWGKNSQRGQGPASDRMTSRSVGWVNGALRTTDGGANWQQEEPDAMLSDAPRGTDPAAYPPGYVDYFLDSNHAWLAYGYPSTGSCFDHVTVVSTSDGGQSWRRSHPVNAAIQADSFLGLQLFFIDPQHGWLMVLGSGRLAPDWFVYTTFNGGIDWQLLQQMPLGSSWCSLEFISLEVGFLGGCQNSSGPSPELTVTRDGGRTWNAVSLPALAGSQQFTVLNPVFFNKDQGVIHISTQVFHDNTSTQSDFLDATDDGGQTWRALPALSIPGYAQSFGFTDPSHFFVLVTDGKGSNSSVYRTADGGRTWSSGGVLPALFQNYPAIMFVDAQHGFVDEPSQQIGASPVAFYQTNDGGRTWKDMHPHLS